MKKKSYPCCDHVCSTCYYFPFCAANSMSGFDSTNKDSPNYEEGIKRLFYESED